MRCRVKFLLGTYLWTLLVFIMAKISFMLFCQEEHPFALTDMWQVVWHGLTLDLSTALYFLILPFLLSIISIWYWAKWLTYILRGYFVLIAIAFALAFVADTSLYPFWEFKLDASCLQYLETPTEAMASVSSVYLVWRFLAIAIASIVIYGGYRPLMLHTACCSSRQWLELLVYILTIPLIVIGIRGGLDESTTNIGQVYYSQNQFLNHSAVNPVFSFLSSFEKTASNIVDYDFYTEDTCQQLMADYYTTTSVDTDTLLTTNHPDVIIILMESAGEVFAKGMPRLQQLKQEGINFANCFANSWRTDRGTVCTYSGYPSFPTSSVMKMPNKTRALPGIASSLQQAGYATTYLYGGDINFTNMRSYLIGTGFSQLIWKDDYKDDERNSAQWGVRDDITFKTLLSLIKHPSDKPRFIGYSTLSSHEPWDVPVKKYDDEILNAFYYLDSCIGEFIDQLKQSPQWKNTLVILLPDHSYDYAGANQTQPDRNRIPMVWTGGAIKGPRQINTICNQTDLAATLLAQLGLTHNQFRWSRDILSRSYQHPLAMHTYRNGFSVTDSTGFMAYDFDVNRIVADKSTDSQRLERIGKAILQATTKDLKELGK
ncbi:LTA synthase family protein [Prevotella sp. P6B1]|uniref:LTA synthase family protein n=1 Tax=Prevotella sp. P6B1 TaxID=1410613 RepID=UPI00051B044B|nr:LTA synthase family protein [Prevotella sp. P6B1]